MKPRVAKNKRRPRLFPVRILLLKDDVRDYVWASGKTGNLGFQSGVSSFQQAVSADRMVKKKETNPARAGLDLRCWLELTPAGELLPCKAHEISDTTAKVHCDVTVDIAEIFNRYFCEDGRVGRKCRWKARTGTELDFEIIGRAQRNPVSTDSLGSITKL